ncbi:hypothetical protein INT47_000163 [Mucor saturninus]|uniref:Uncharacterized protein n=1 Tax=Mucor saturninus TaxID=64648 RepID=A0A8H7RJX8_9FUNG|nr:hypothetical protein INT47_000163 [Mucor saturninus]
MALSSTVGVHVVRAVSDSARRLVLNAYGFVNHYSMSLKHHETPVNNISVIGAAIESSRSRILLDKPDILFKLAIAVKHAKLTMDDKKFSASIYNNYMVSRIRETKNERNWNLYNYSMMDVFNTISQISIENNEIPLFSNDEWIDTEINPSDEYARDATNKYKEPVDYDHEYRDKDQDDYNEQ